MMRSGPLIRRLFGPYEREVAEAYRRIFIDLDAFAGLISTWVPRAQRILEVGCGEGAMTERIARTYPDASVMAIDIAPNIGRLFREDNPGGHSLGRQSSAVTFCQETVEEVSLREPASFDLVVLSDVLHHVPVEARASLISAIDRAMAPNGSLVFKDWVISASPIHWLCAASDRYLTGDKVAYFTADGINALVTSVFGPGTIRQTATVKPRSNNVAVLVRRSNGFDDQPSSLSNTR
jgi:2-polyprenyl-3-methyl-5-hydroxy-6-metoxy-1,4-benzoquinol methylase